MDSHTSKLLELLTRLLCDTHCECTADAVYLFAQTQDNQDSVLSAAGGLLDQSLVHRVLILQTTARCGYPGYEYWREKLTASGIPDDCIQGVNLEAEIALNTLVEAEALIDHARLNGYENLYITASPFHQLRAYMTSVTAAMRKFPGLNLYSHAGNPLPWLESVAHSQGNCMGTRAALIHSELGRIEKYQEKGDLASVESVLEHLNNRESRGQL